MSGPGSRGIDRRHALLFGAAALGGGLLRPMGAVQAREGWPWGAYPPTEVRPIFSEANAR